MLIFVNAYRENKDKTHVMNNLSHEMKMYCVDRQSSRYLRLSSTVL